MAFSAVHAIEAAATVFADVHDPDRMVATSLDNDLWAVNAVDGEGRPWAGVLVVVGPDRKVWTFSSNPGIHDPETVVASLRDIYASGVAASVDRDRLAERIAAATAEIHAQRRAVVAEAVAGSLRAQAPRRLP